MTTESTDDLPAGVASRTVDSNGTIKYWDGKGMLHNPDGPSVIRADKATYWLVTGRDPDEMPDGWFGSRLWHRHGVLHRTDGPAVERGDGTGFFYVEGFRFSEDEFNRRYPASQGVSASDPLP